MGARGILQLMPPTFDEVCKKLKIVANNPYDPETNIMCGIYYDSYLFRQFMAERTLVDKLKFVFAAYNAGLGNILKAQKYSIANYPKNNPNTWESIKVVAHFIPSWKCDETLDYVDRINRVYNELKTQKPA